MVGLSKTVYFLKSIQTWKPVIFDVTTDDDDWSCIVQMYYLFGDNNNNYYYWIKWAVTFCSWSVCLPCSHSNLLLWWKGCCVALCQKLHFVLTRFFYLMNVLVHHKVFLLLLINLAGFCWKCTLIACTHCQHFRISSVKLELLTLICQQQSGWTWLIFIKRTSKCLNDQDAFSQIFNASSTLITLLQFLHVCSEALLHCRFLAIYSCYMKHYVIIEM